MNIPALWALELSPKACALLRELGEHDMLEGEAHGVGHASETLREALLLGLNTMARDAGLVELEVQSEREATHATPVVIDVAR